MDSTCVKTVELLPQVPSPRIYYLGTHVYYYVYIIIFHTRQTLRDKNDLTDHPNTRENAYGYVIFVETEYVRNIDIRYA